MSRRYSQRHPRRPAQALPPPARMARSLRLAAYVSFGALWISGTAWIVAHFGFERQSEFGSVPSPWEPTWLRLHGLLAVLAVFLLGWLAAIHVAPQWSSGRRRLSGIALACGALVLVASGYALYYSIDRTHELIAALHEIVGLAALLLALPHWIRPGAESQMKLRLMNQKVPMPTSAADPTSTTIGRGNESRARASSATTPSSAKTTAS